MLMTLYTAVFGKLGMATEELETACRRWGMKINVAKRKILSGDDRRKFIDNTRGKWWTSLCFWVAYSAGYLR